MAGYHTLMVKDENEMQLTKDVLSDSFCSFNIYKHAFGTYIIVYQCNLLEEFYIRRRIKKYKFMLYRKHRESYRQMKRGGALS